MTSQLALLILGFAAGAIISGLFHFLKFLRQSGYRSFPRRSGYFVRYHPTEKRWKNDLSEQAIHDLTVVIPAYNEESRIEAMLRETISFLEDRSRANPSYSSEIIVVDDGSKDRTVESICAIFDKAKPRFVNLGIIQFPKNQGKGAAISEGILASRGKQILFADADGATKICELEKLEKVVAYKTKGMACGSRSAYDNSCVVERHFIRAVLMKAFKVFVRLWGVKTVKDTQCGFKLMTREAARMLIPNLRLNRWIFDVELLLLAERLAVEVHEVPVNWTEMKGSKLSLATDSIRMATDLMFMRLAYSFGFWRVHQAA